jgi:hypothetical protein
VAARVMAEYERILESKGLGPRIPRAPEAGRSWPRAASE